MGSAAGAPACASVDALLLQWSSIIAAVVLIVVVVVVVVVPHVDLPGL